MGERANPGSKQRRDPAWLSARTMLAVIAAALLAGSPCVRAQSLTEYQVKAAFLYNFAKFIEWPGDIFATPESPVQICVLGENPFGGDLDHIVQGKSVSGHPVKVRALPRNGQDVRSCQIVFATAPALARLKPALTPSGSRGILIVSENTAGEDTMINFVLENDRVRFEVNNKAAAAAGLKISSKLLALAIRVIE